MNTPTRELLRKAVVQSIKQLACNDGILFSAPIEQYSPNDARKLHEVCINHKFAEYLAGEILPLFEKTQRMFVDIEFNREGVNFKEATIDGETKRVRPDIIVHNRRSKKAKNNFLVIECKKSDADLQDIKDDCNKIEVLMTNPLYDYNYGLQVLYDALVIKGTLFYKQDGAIKKEPLEYNIAQDTYSETR
jgi:hypothetical protein